MFNVDFSPTAKLEGASLTVYWKPSNAESNAKILGKVLVDTKVYNITLPAMCVCEVMSEMPYWLVPEMML